MKPVTSVLLEICRETTVPERPQSLWGCNLSLKMATSGRCGETVLCSVTDAIVCERGFIFDEKSGNPIFHIDEYPVFPKYVIDYYNSGMVYPSYGVQTVYDLRIPEMKKIHIEHGLAFTHFNVVYGHWLIEMLPKLLAFRDVALKTGIRAPIIIPRMPGCFIETFVREVCPGFEFVIYNPNIEYVAVEKLFLISNTENFWLNPYFCSEYEFYGTKPLNDDSGDDQRIFIVRPDDHVKRNSIKNFADIESFLLEKGFKNLDPSRLGSLREQARIFNKAKVIVGEFSSSLHNAIFSRKGSQIIALNFVNDVQNQIAVMRGHKIGYIVPTRGPVHWADKEPYQLEMSDVRNAVEIATSHR